jgi:hypothetical protein
MLEEVAKEVAGKETESPMEERRKHHNLFVGMSSPLVGHH